MFKKGIALFIICIFMVSLVGCSSLAKEVEETGEKPSIRGIITDINREVDGKNIIIWVEGQPSKDMNYDRATIKITEETTIIENQESRTVDEIFIGMTVEAFFTGPVAESYPVQAVAKKIKILDVQQEVTLDFISVQPSVLREGSPEEDWVLEGLIDYTEEFNNEVVEVYLYRREDEEDASWGEIIAYLYDEKAMYEIGVVSSYGIRSLKVEIDDVTGKGSNEILFTGSMGATYVETNIIGKDDDGNWVLWLSGGSYSHVDLDGSGQKEWVATSRGSLPPFVVIYRWNGEMFEWADINPALGSNYANLLENKEEYTIESGMWVLDQATGEFVTSKREYIYRDGRLLNRNGN